MDDLPIEHRERWRMTRLNRPQAKNALDTTLLGRSAQILALAGAGRSSQIVATTGQGDFAAGADIAGIATMGPTEGATDLLIFTQN